MQYHRDPLREITYIVNPKFKVTWRKLISTTTHKGVLLSYADLRLTLTLRDLNHGQVNLYTVKIMCPCGQFSQISVLSLLLIYIM